MERRSGCDPVLRESVEETEADCEASVHSQAADSGRGASIDASGRRVLAGAGCAGGFALHVRGVCDGGEAVFVSTEPIKRCYITDRKVVGGLRPLLEVIREGVDWFSCG